MSMQSSGTNELDCEQHDVLLLLPATPGNQTKHTLTHSDAILGTHTDRFQLDFSPFPAKLRENTNPTEFHVMKACLP